MTDTTMRDTELRAMLTERLRLLQDDVQGRIREGRSDRPTDVGDMVEYSDAATQSDIELALLQMRAEALVRVEEALARLDSGQYGTCFACGEDIAEPRLRALPFAVRCRACEEKRERTNGRARVQSVASLMLFADTISS